MGDEIPSRVRQRYQWSVQELFHALPSHEVFCAHEFGIGHVLRGLANLVHMRQGVMGK